MYPSTIAFSTLINPQQRDRFVTRTAGGGVHFAPPLTRHDQLEIRIRCLPPFRVRAFQRCHPRENPTSPSTGNQDGGRKNGSSDNFWTAWDNDAGFNSTPTFSTKPDLNMTLSTLPTFPDVAVDRFKMAATETGSGNTYWTQWAGDTIPKQSLH